MKEGLLANLWEFPNMEIALPFQTEKEQLEETLQSEYGAQIEIGKMVGQLEHVFSHLIWNIHVYEGKLLELEKEADNLKLVNEVQIKQYPFSVSHNKISKQFYEE